MRISIAPLAIALLVLSCETPTEPNGAPLAAGWYATVNGAMALHVTDTNAVLFLGCYSAAFARPFVDRHGRFDVDGFISGGPGPPPPVSSPGSPAHFSGQAEGSKLTLTMTTQSQFFGATVHTYALQFTGAQPTGPVQQPCP